MPFDSIVVTMALKTYRKFSAVFFFEYFKKEKDQTRTKLAFGEQTVAWVTRDSNGKPVLSEFPEKIKKNWVIVSTEAILDSRQNTFFKMVKN